MTTLSACCGAGGKAGVCKAGTGPQSKAQENCLILPQEVHDHPGNRGTSNTQQLMESSLHLPIHPEGRGTSDLAMRSHAELSLEEATFFLLQGRHLYIREEQDWRRIHELRIAPLRGHSPTVPEWGQGADSNRPR